MNMFDDNMSALVLLFLTIGCASAAIYDDLIVPIGTYQLPQLPYGYTALEPFIDAATLAVHHQGHHKSYTDKLNVALAEWRTQRPSELLSRKSIVEQLQHLNQVPERWRTAIRNNGGGYANHVLYWATMCPSPVAPGETLLQKINTSFGDMDSFKQQFSEAAKTLFGSGYVWLCQRDTEELEIVKTQNQDTPISDGLWPILVLDVWEHSYYLQHQYKRADYISSWWEVVCWSEVENLRLFWQSIPHGETHSEL